MDIVSVPRGTVDRARPGQGIREMKEAGFQNILLDMAEALTPWELEGAGEGSVKKLDGALIGDPPSVLGESIKLLSGECRKYALQTPIARAPYLLRGTKRGDLKGQLFLLAQEAIRACGEAGCKTIIIKPLFSGLSPEGLWEANRSFYLSLLPAAKGHKVQVLLENQSRDRDGHLIRGACSDPREAAAWVDRLNDEAGEGRFGFCMDVGSCNICGQDMQEFAGTLGSRVKGVILRDNDGQRDLSALAFTNTSYGGRPQADWLGLVRGLRSAGFDGYLILDFADTAAGFPPLLRPRLLGLAKATAEYLKWQIGMENTLKKYPSLVLFGAGNMCRNYMKCYGETYPPLFTCDNNPQLWGTDFCGLEVKPPESLKGLPKDCAILVCNVYYREVTQQLCSMGIDNRIDYFSDEYMPSFYFDRIEKEACNAAGQPGKGGRKEEGRLC
ncbi:MAG: sugar phosphate isomerase/epimerase [Lachnospiraceae bacterium]|nr:sugar phosphate isomerase/epimerase [Lachnospiraceae bacterium]